MELLIAICCFLLSATVLLRLFAAANGKSVRAAQMTMALNAAEDAADAALSADGAEGAEEALAALGFEQTGDGWTRDDGAYRLRVTLEETPQEAGVLLRGAAEALAGEETLFALPLARYRGDAR